MELSEDVTKQLAYKLAVIIATNANEWIKIDTSPELGLDLDVTRLKKLIYTHLINANIL